jgi:uncharacterized protein YjbI with pentapeptide repeats
LNFRKMDFRSPVGLTAIGVAATLVLSLLVVIVLLRTGGAKAVSDNAALIGALVALGGVFTAQMVSIALEDGRTREARELEAQRADDAALQNYIEQVGTLLIEQPLREAGLGDNLSTVVRAQTLSVLEGMEPERKQILLLFLYESGLIRKDKPVIILAAANLSLAALSEANLNGAYLFKAILYGTHLVGAYLVGAHLSEANLSGANLVGAHLSEAALDEADLSAPDWPDEATNLTSADLSGATLWGANLHGANLYKTNLYWAGLNEANLRDANLSEANLRGANLYEADLNGAYLIEADLSGVTGITSEELQQQAANLEGATMPNGQKYEDWLKDKGQGE